MLEVVGVTGVVHMGQIQSGLRGGVRVAQGGHVSPVMKSRDKHLCEEKYLYYLFLA